MQEVRRPHEPEKWHRDAQIEVALPVLVLGDAPVDIHKEDIFRQRGPTSIGAQALPAYLAHDA